MSPLQALVEVFVFRGPWGCDMSRLFRVCEYPDLPAHECQYVEEENHLRAWHTLSVRLDLHLTRNHGVRPSSNGRDWGLQHVMAHEDGGHGLEIHPANHTLAIREAIR